MTLAAPLLAVMTASSRVVLKAFGARQVREGGVHSPEELKLIVSASRRIGILEAPQEQIIQRALDLENVFVREIMVPRPDIFSLPGDMPLDEAFQTRRRRAALARAGLRSAARAGAHHRRALCQGPDALAALSLGPSMSGQLQAGPATSKCGTSCARCWSFPKPSRCPIC